MGQRHQITRSKKGCREQNQVLPAEYTGPSPGAPRPAASSRKPVTGRPPACGPQAEAPTALPTRRRALGRARFWGKAPRGGGGWAQDRAGPLVPRVPGPPSTRGR